MAKWEQIVKEAKVAEDAEAVIRRWLRSSLPAVNRENEEVGSGRRFDQYHGWQAEDD